MTRDEVKILLIKMESLYPNFKIKDTTLTIDAWYSVLEPYPGEMINASLNLCVATEGSDFPPSVSKLIQRIAKINDDSLTEGEVMSYLTKASRNANYGYADEFRNFPPLLQKAVGSADVIRSWGTAEPNELNYVFGNIAKRYREMADENTRMSVVPLENVENLKRLADLREGLLKRLEMNKG